MCDGAVQNVTTGGPAHETTVSGLTPNGSLYTFQLAAVHNEITGPFSHLVNSTTGICWNYSVYFLCMTTLVFVFFFFVFFLGTPSACPTEDTGNIYML